MSSKRSAFNAGRLIRSFGFAFKGLFRIWRREPNARIHLIAAVGVIASGIYFHLSSQEWISIVIAIGLVFSAELFNTALETLADRVSPEFDPEIGRVKDFAAAAVLVVSITAMLIGAWVFLPHFLGS